MTANIRRSKRYSYGKCCMQQGLEMYGMTSEWLINCDHNILNRFIFVSLPLVGHVGLDLNRSVGNFISDHWLSEHISCFRNRVRLFFGIAYENSFMMMLLDWNTSMFDHSYKDSFMIYWLLYLFRKIHLQTPFLLLPVQLDLGGVALTL